jgi:hypothetical protein
MSVPRHISIFQALMIGSAANFNRPRSEAATVAKRIDSEKERKDQIESLIDTRHSMS